MAFHLLDNDKKLYTDFVYITVSTELEAGRSILVTGLSYTNIPLSFMSNTRKRMTNRDGDFVKARHEALLSYWWASSTGLTPDLDDFIYDSSKDVMYRITEIDDKSHDPNWWMYRFYLTRDENALRNN